MSKISHGTTSTRRSWWAKLRIWWRKRQAPVSTQLPISALPGESAFDVELPPPRRNAPIVTEAHPSTLQSASIPESERAALQAMIERKRRNDFVRKREFDILRRARREGLSLEQIGDLGASSRVDEDEAPEDQMLDRSVRDKISLLEEQMVGSAPMVAPEPNARSLIRGTESRAAEAPVSQSLGLSSIIHSRQMGSASRAFDHNPETVPSNVGRFDPKVDGKAVERRLLGLPDEPAFLASQKNQTFQPTQMMEDDSSERSDLPKGWSLNELQWQDALQFTDPRLDDVALTLSQGDLDRVEQQLQGLTSVLLHSGKDEWVWHAWLDFLQTTGQKKRFEEQARQYALNFDRLLPNWLEIEAAAHTTNEVLSRFVPVNRVDWICPQQPTMADLYGLERQAESWNHWVVLDWSELTTLDLSAASALSRLFRMWVNRSLDMRWEGGDVLLAQIEKNLAGTPVDVGFAFWQLRVAALNLLDRRDAFEDAQSEYVRATEGMSLPALRVWGQPVVRAAIIDRSVDEDAAVHPALLGALQGDITVMLQRLEKSIPNSGIIDCSAVMWVENKAAECLSQWAQMRQENGYPVVFRGVQRLAALHLRRHGVDRFATLLVRKF